MLGKDLIYALQTRSKKLIRELERFADDIENVSLEDGWTLVIETVTLVRELAPTHDKYSHLIKAVNRAWLAFAEVSDANADALYRHVTDSLEQTDWTDADPAQAAYQLLYAFRGNHLQFPGGNAHLRHGLRRQSPRILSLILRLLPYSRQTLFKTPVKPHTGAGADAIDMLLGVYFYHCALSGDDDLRADAAQLLPQLVSADPRIGDGLAMSLLRRHPERADIVCQLIGIYLGASEADREFGMFYDVMLELLDNDGDSFLYDDLDKITARLTNASARWTGEQLETFTQYAFFYRLSEEEDRRRLLSKSAKARRLARMLIARGHAGPHIDALRALCETIKEDKPVKPRPASARQFEDLNFKLLVIQNLMYDEEILQPRFELDDFVKHYTAREIMVRKEGYELIPEVRDYFDALLIPPQLLAQVEDLYFDGGAQIYSQLFPYWDGECDIFDPASVADIRLLPNLKRMSDMPDRFIEQHAATLRERGIEVD